MNLCVLTDWCTRVFMDWYMCVIDTILWIPINMIYIHHYA